MMRKYCFNMIEIILAISIISIGISSVMVLFTSGIKTGNASVVSNNLPDAMESLVTHIRQQIDDCRGVSGWNTTKLDKIAPATVSSTPWDVSSLLTASGDDETIKSDNAGSFLYRQSVTTKFDNNGKATEFAPSFSAIATVERISSPPVLVLSNPLATEKEALTTVIKDEDNVSGNDLVNNFRLVVKVTVSYPADAPAAVREKKVYILEFFNDKYDKFSRGEGINAP